LKITTISVDGFGQFHGAHLEPAPGLTVIRGVNEAGKTTLLAFVRAILFGFEIDRYPALEGGRRGGWLDVEMQDGRPFRIERYGERGGGGTLKVFDHGGTNLGDGYLATLLQGVEKKVYRNIFAFGLEELTQFERLTDNEVAARIYGAGLGTGSVSGLDIENALRDEREALFKPGGQNPKINGLLRILEETDERLRDRDLPADYGDAGRRLAEVEVRLSDIGERHGSLAADRRARQRVGDGWATWLDLLQARADREELGTVRTFPAPTLERLGRLETAVDNAGHALLQAEQVRDRAAADLEAATLDEDALARRADLEALIESSRVQAARREERARTDRDLAAAGSRVATAVNQLGPGWTVERIEPFDDSIAVHAEIDTRFRGLLDRATDAVASARRDLAANDGRLAETAAQVEATAARIGELNAALGEGPPHADRERGLRELEALVQRLEERRSAATDRPERDLQAERAALDQRARDGRDLAAAIEAERNVRELLAGAVAPTPAVAGQGLRRWLGPLAVGASGLALAVVLAVGGSPAIAGIVALVAVSVAVAWAVLAGRTTPSPVEGIRRQLETQLERATSTISRTGEALGLGPAPAPGDVALLTATLDDERHRLDRELDRLDRAEAAAGEATALERRLAEKATALGLPPAPAGVDLEAFGRQIATDREVDARRAGLLEQQAQLRVAAEGLGRRREELAMALADRTAEAEQAHGEWQSWLDAHGLEPDLDRETASRVVEAVSAAKAAVTGLRTLEIRRDELVAEEAVFVAQVAALAALLPQGRFDQADPVGAVALLARRHAAALDGERAKLELKRALADRTAAADEARVAGETATEALATFLAGLEAPDADALRAEVDRSLRAAALDEAVAASTRALTTLSGPGEALAAFEGDLSAVLDIDLVRDDVAGLDDQLATLAGERDVLNQEAGALRNRRAEMERDAAATELRQRRADVQAQLVAAADRWTVLALAKDLLARSRAAYEEAHRPAVVQAAERYFAEWTDGRYARIIAPLGSPIESVELSSGSRVSLAGLSRGTSEQLYLALRFGLVERFVETSGESLPIVMDDILVNFDDDRAARAARSIESLAGTCQIIYFTCHPTTPLKAEVEKTLRPLDAR